MTRVRFLGSGWSHGVPVLGCHCPVCTGNNPFNQRRRPSIHIQSENVSVVVDVGPDFRMQALEYGISDLDTVLITHAHADHVMGMDDLRRFTWEKEQPLPVYSDAPTRKRLKVLYPYAAASREPGKAVPLVDFRIWEGPLVLGTLCFTSFPVPHGGMSCLGIRMDTPHGSMGYVPDCNDLPAEAMSALQGVDTMILNAMRTRPHPNHLTLERSRELLQQLNAPLSIFTHLGCPIDYGTVQPTLPKGFQLACDGMVVELTGKGPALILPES